MTTAAPPLLPGQRVIDCHCGHPKAEHDELAPQCAHTACTCLRYRPKTQPAPPNSGPITSGPPPCTVPTGATRRPAPSRTRWCVDRTDARSADRRRSTVGVQAHPAARRQGS